MNVKRKSSDNYLSVLLVNKYPELRLTKFCNQTEDERFMSVRGTDNRKIWKCFPFTIPNDECQKREKKSDKNEGTSFARKLQQRATNVGGKFSLKQLTKYSEDATG